MNITLQRLKNAVKDIKSEWYEGNDSHSTAEYRGACESLDMLLTHFQELDDFKKWKKEKRDANKKDKKARLKYTYSTKGFIKWFPMPKEDKI